MNSPVRLFISILLAIPVVVGLFMIMHSLIDRDFENPEKTNTKIADLVQPDEEIQLETTVPKPTCTTAQTRSRRRQKKVT